MTDMMLNGLVLGATMTGGLLVAQAGFDMAVAKKWEDAKMIRYHAVGVYQARNAVVFGDYEGKADVTDRITVDFVFDRKKGKVVGEVTVADSKSELKNIKSDDTNCPPPTLKGDYEQFQYVKYSVDPSSGVHLTGVRSYPAAAVSNYPGSCSMRAIPGGKEDTTMVVPAGDPAVLAMPMMPAGSPIIISPDRKTYSMKGGDNWVWTLTPTVLQ